MNINFSLFVQLEPMWLFILFILFYFVSSFEMYKYLVKKFFFFNKPNLKSIKKRFLIQNSKKNTISEIVAVSFFSVRYFIFLLFVYYLLFNYIFCVEYNKLFLVFHLYNYCWIYGNFIICFLFIYTVFLYFSNFSNYLRNVEHLFGIAFLFLNMHFFIFSNNLILMIFLFEIQSIIFIYYIALLQFNYVNFNYLSRGKNLYLKSFNFSWYLNSLFFQFWTSFVSAIFFVYGIFNIYRNVGVVDWQNLEIFFFYLNRSWQLVSYFEFLVIWLFFFIGLLLKIGFFPFFLWKPEIYKNFNIFILFFYMFIYLFFVLFFLFFFFNTHLILIKHMWFVYIYYVFTIATIIILFYLYSIQDIRSFLAYSSSLNLCYLLVILTINGYSGAAMFLFYLFIYFYYTFSFFAFIFLISNNFLWYIVDLQYLGNFIFLVCFFFSFFFGLAGIPPFLGFFSKIGVVSNLLYHEQYFFFFYLYWLGCLLLIFICSRIDFQVIH